MHNNKRMIKRGGAILLALTLAVSSTIFGNGAISTKAYAADNNLTAVKVPAPAGYKATTIVNGGFESRPWMNYTLDGVGTVTRPDTYYNDRAVSSHIPNGVDGGWNTTENKVFDGGLFEWLSASTVCGPWHAPGLNMAGRGYYSVEMNAHNAATLYQDLSTNSGDIIRWTLMHAARPAGDSLQTMRVEIGAPTRESGNIVYPSGVGASINTRIDASTKASYTSAGVANGGSVTYGYGNLEELANLDVSSTDTSKKKSWHMAAGVYVIPDDQPVTRFAFISTARTPDIGNYLDDITFSTLLGHFDAKSYTNGNVKVTGYWGETDPTKKLVVSLDGREYPIDMSAVAGTTGSFFEVEIPATTVGTAQTATVWHEDYRSAVKEVEILKYVNYGTDGLNNISVTRDDATEVEPTKRVSGNYDPENNPSCSADLVINLTDSHDKLTLYKLADTTYSEREVEGITVGHYDTRWVTKVDEWIKANPSYSSVYEDPMVLGANSEENMRAKFYKDMLANTGNVITNGPISPLKENVDMTGDLTTTFENLPFGVYAVMASNSTTGDTYAPLVVSIIPYENGPSGSYYVKYTYKASLKDANATLDKYINGKPSSTVAIGDVIDYKLDVSIPLYKARETAVFTDGEWVIDPAKDYRLYVEDEMADVFAIYDTNEDGIIDEKDIKVTYTYTDGEGTVHTDGVFPTDEVSYYVLGTKTEETGEGIKKITGADNHAQYTYDTTYNTELLNCQAIEWSGKIYNVEALGTFERGKATRFRVHFNVPALKAWLKQGDTPSSIDNVNITYSAEVTEKVAYGSDININKATLHTDGNDPIPSNATVYTYALKLFKVDGQTVGTDEVMRLPGAEFKIYKETDVFVKKKDGTYEWLGDVKGSDANTLWEETDEDATPEKLSKSEYYIYEELEALDLSGENKVETLALKENESTHELEPVILTSADAESYNEGTLVHVYKLYTVNTKTYTFDGTFKTLGPDDTDVEEDYGTYLLNGLNVGNYVITETNAPAGYNDLAEDILFSINKLTEDEAQIKTYKAFKEMDGKLNEKGLLELTVLNYKGLTLPSTGGMGTTLFIVIGIGLMAGVMVLLVAKRRKASFQ